METVDYDKLKNSKLQKFSYCFKANSICLLFTHAFCFARTMHILGKASLLYCLADFEPDNLAIDNLPARSCGRSCGRCRCRRRNSLFYLLRSCWNSDRRRYRSSYSDCLGCWFPGTLDSALLLAELVLRKKKNFIDACLEFQWRLISQHISFDHRHHSNLSNNRPFWTVTTELSGNFWRRHLTALTLSKNSDYFLERSKHRAFASRVDRVVILNRRDFFWRERLKIWALSEMIAPFCNCWKQAKICVRC